MGCVCIFWVRRERTTRKRLAENDSKKGVVALVTRWPVLVIVGDGVVLFTAKVIQLIDSALERHKLCSSTLTTPTSTLY